MTQTDILLDVGTNELEILEFYINETRDDGSLNRIYFGMNVAKVMQVIENPNLVHCDYSQHPSFLGTIALREHILPIIDLGVYLGVKVDSHPFDLIIATEFSQSVNGFLVSGVTEILRIGWDHVKPPGTFLEKYATSVIIGTVEHQGRFIQLLDMESILTSLDPTLMTMSDSSDVQAQHPYPVLVADDSQTILAMIVRNLVAAGMKPFTVSNGDDAWKKLLGLKAKAQTEGIDILELVRIVISDIEMPMLDGFTLTKRIKEDPCLAVIPVILYSSIITKELRHKGDFVKADDQVSKPELHEMAKRALKLIEGVGEKGLEHE